MRIALAQCQSVPGDMQANAAHHERFISKAVEEAADMIVFPELSLCNYEPTLASQCALSLNGQMLNHFQALADKSNIAILPGAPLQKPNGITIAMPIFRPFEPLVINEKQYLHADEFPFFIPGENLKSFSYKGIRISLAICYELSVEEHTVSVMKENSSIFLVSVSKTFKGIEAALQTLSAIAKQYGIHVLMVNNIGEADGSVCAGCSSVWNIDGALIGQLASNVEGLLYFDTETGNTSQHIMLSLVE